MKSLKAARVWLADNWKLVAFLAGCTAASWWLSRVPDQYWAAIGSNLFAGFVGAAVTVLGIEYLVAGREKRRTVPMRAAAYEGVRLITAHSLGLYRDAYVHSVNDSEPQSWHDLFSTESLAKLGSYLDVFKSANVTPPRPWHAHIDQTVKDIVSRAGRTLDRYGRDLTPDVHRALQMLEYYVGPELGILVSHGALKEGMGIGDCWGVSSEWFDALLELHAWTCEEHTALVAAGAENIFEPFRFVSYQLPKASARLAR